MSFEVLGVKRELHKVHLALLQVTILGCNIADQTRPLILNMVYHLLIIGKLLFARLELSQSLAYFAPPEMIHLDRKLDYSMVDLASDTTERPGAVGEHGNELIDEVKAVAVEENICELLVFELLEALIDDHELGEARLASLVVRIIRVPGHLHLC